MWSLVSRTQATPPASLFRARPPDLRSSSDPLGGLGTQLLCASAVLTVRWESSTGPQEERRQRSLSEGHQKKPDSWPLWPLYAQATSKALMGASLCPFVKCFLKSLGTHSFKPYYPNEGIATSGGYRETRGALKDGDCFQKHKPKKKKTNKKHKPFLKLLWLLAPWDWVLGPCEADKGPLQARSHLSMPPSSHPATHLLAPPRGHLPHRCATVTMRERHPSCVVLAMQAFSLEGRLDLAALHHLSNFHNHGEQPPSSRIPRKRPRPLGLVSHDLRFYMFICCYLSLASRFNENRNCTWLMPLAHTRY